MLTKDQILASLDIAKEEVQVPEWGGSVFVRGMTGLERDAFGTSLRNPDGSVNLDSYRAKLLVCCVVDEQGNALFTPADAAALNGKSSLALDRVFKVAERLNSLGNDALDAAEKN